MLFRLYKHNKLRKCNKLRTDQWFLCSSVVSILTSCLLQFYAYSWGWSWSDCALVIFLPVDAGSESMTTRVVYTACLWRRKRCSVIRINNLGECFREEKRRCSRPELHKFCHAFVGPILSLFKLGTFGNKTQGQTLVS